MEKNDPNSFFTSLLGKCLLAGEHSVMRGYPAIVVPVKGREFIMNFEGSPAGDGLEISCKSDESHKNAFVKVLDKAFEISEVPRESLNGKIEIQNSIPTGSGLGASAAFCVSVARLWVEMGWLAPDRVIGFGTELENLFHGKSSGVDVALVHLNAPIRYQMDQAIEALCVEWKPYLYVSHCGESAKTKDCVRKVERLFEEKPSVAKEVDRRMGEAVDQFQEALVGTMDFDQAASAIEKAASCFEDWDLVSPKMASHRNELQGLGAKVTKPTGSGWGGYVLSLWDKEPPESFLEISLPCLL